MAVNGQGKGATLRKILSSRPQAPVLILPTAKDANVFNQLYHTAVAIPATSAYGHCEELAGRKVSVWHVTDADTTHFAEELLLLGIEPEVIDDAGELVSIADWFAQGATKEQFYAYVRANTLRHEPKRAVVPRETPKRATLSALPAFKDALSCWTHFNLAIGSGTRPWPNIDNVQRILALHPQTANRFQYDEFGDRILCDGKPWNADDVTDLTTLLQRELYFHHIRTAVVMEAVEAYARLHRIHPVRVYLEALKPHDGLARVNQFFTAACGAAPSDYMCAVSRSFLVSAIARIYEPGCIVRTMPVLEGAQGSGKSTTLALLGGPFYLDNARKIDSKEFEQDIQGYWIIELSELVSMMKGSAEGAKAALTRRDDVFRFSYGRRARPHPRSCIFAGTTNSYSWQLDDTGGTRFLPVSCQHIDTAWTANNRDQLWAEALTLYRANSPWWDIPQAEAIAEQDARHVSDSWEETILTILDARETVTLVELYELMDIKLQERDQRSDNRLVRILERAKWRRRIEKRKNLSGSWCSVRVYRPQI